MRVFENRLLRRMFGPKKVEVTGECRRIYNEEILWSVLLTKYYLVDEIKKNKVGVGACNTYRRQEKSERKRQLGIPRH